MAHSARSQTLVDDLISSITGVSVEHARFKLLRSIAARGLRNQSHARTNQFEVRAKYEGLIEKFSVLNRDDLAEAVQLRWTELPERPSQTQPEILSLLLLLSDRPVEKTNLACLNKSHPQDEVIPSITWQRIIEDDPFTDDDVWRDVERGYHSSGDEERSLEGLVLSDSTDSTRATTTEDDPEALARLQISQLHIQSYSFAEKYFLHLEQAQAAGENVEVSEVFLTKETISMLQGLPSRLYKCDKDGNVSIHNHFVLATASSSTVTDQLQRCAERGSIISTLRQWCRTGYFVAQDYKRICQSDVQDVLNDLDGNLAALEHRLLRLNTNIIVSLIHVTTEIHALTRPLEQLCVKIVKPTLSSTAGTHVLLDMLYSTACEAQMSDDSPLFFLCARLLVRASNIFLRSVRTWIHSGKVEEPHDCCFVDEAASKDWSLGTMWVARFRLKLDPATNRASAPSFLQPFIDQIFAMGKSQALLKELAERSGKHDSYNNAVHDTTDFVSWPELNAELAQMPLSPFSELFDQHLTYWLMANASQTRDLLKTRLISQEKVLDFPGVLGHVFHSSDGIEFQSFAATLFSRLEQQQTTWHDDFLLTEMAQETLGSCEGVDAASISVNAQTKSHKTDMTAVEKLERISLTFAIAWPLQNITHEVSPTVDAEAFSLLLQAHYAKSLLGQPMPGFRQNNSKRSGINQPLLKLRYSLLWFTNLFLAHIGDTTQLLRRELRESWKKADGVDSMAAYYRKYCNDLEVQLLLGRNLKPLKKSVTDIFNLASFVVQSLEEPSSDRNTANQLGLSFDRCLSFIISGLKGVSRAERNLNLESLAEKLDPRATFG